MMETPNRQTSDMEITNATKSKIFGQYLDHKVQVRKKNDRDKEHLIGRICEVTRGSNHGDWIMVWFDEVETVTNMEWREMSSNAHTFFFGEDETKLILKPLSAISDEDAIKLINLYNEDAKEISLIDGIIYYEHEWLGETMEETTDLSNFKDTCYPACVYQFLISRGYDLPQYLLNGKTLHESNLCIYDNA